MIRWKHAVTGAAGLALMLSGCSAGGNSSGSSDSSDETATLITIAAPSKLDPAGASMGSMSAYYEALYDTLLRYDSSGELQGWLATDWSYDTARTQLTLKIRDGVSFTDGSSLDADVVVRNLERFKAGTAATASSFASVQSIEAPDKSTVVISLAQPNPAFLTALAREGGLIASGEALDDPDLATKPVGSGPYVLDQEATVVGSTYHYSKNPNYWNPEVQHFSALTIQAMPDASGITNAIKAGEADVAQLPQTAVSQAEGAGWTVDQISVGGFAGLMLFDRDGQLSPPLADERVRQALNYALDRPALIKAMAGGVGTPTTQVFPQNGKGYDESLDSKYPHDPAKAKALLAEAGYPDGVKISLPDFGNRDRFTILAQMLAEAGITIEWAEGQLQNSIADILTPKFSAVFFTLGEPTDWGTVQQIIAPNATFNPFHSSDPELQKMIDTMQIGDDATQAEMARNINKYIVEHAWFAPVQPAISIIGSSPDVSVTAPTMQTFPSIFDIQPK